MSEMKQILDRLTEMGQDIKDIKADVAELKTDVAELKADVAELRGFASLPSPQRRGRFTGFI